MITANLPKPAGLRPCKRHPNTGGGRRRAALLQAPLRASSSPAPPLHQQPAAASNPTPAATPAAPHPSAAVAAAPDPAAATRSVGCLVGGAAGAAIGLSVEPARAFRISRLFPEGLTDVWRFSAAPAAARRGSGDFYAAVLGARALSDGGCEPDTGRLLDALAGGYASARDRNDNNANSSSSGGDAAASASTMSYSPYTGLCLEALAAGVEPSALARLADAFMDLSAERRAATSSDRAERAPYGAADHGAALRAAPLGLALALRGDGGNSGGSGSAVAAAAARRSAVDAWTLWSHPTAAGLDGANAAAAAVAWLANAQTPAADSTSSSSTSSGGPNDLLDAVEAAVETDDMRAKLALVRATVAAVGQLPAIPDTGASSVGSSSSGSTNSIGSWREFWASEQWTRLVDAHGRLTVHGHATLATQATAVGLLALCVNYARPAQAVSIAASLGGAAAATGGLTGAFAGALHGVEWLPQRWWDAMGEAEASRRVRDESVDAGLKLAAAAAAAAKANAAA